MAEINTDNNNKGKKGGKVRAKKNSTRVDMTPMVDLAFLLLTFFMLATTFIKPQVMNLTLPKPTTEVNDQPLVNEKRVLNIILDENNKILWYMGLTDAEVKETDYSATGIREVLQDNTNNVDKLVVLVKPQVTSTYENLVDILDEMEICGVSRYALVDITDEDREILARYKN